MRRTDTCSSPNRLVHAGTQLRWRWIAWWCFALLMMLNIGGCDSTQSAPTEVGLQSLPSDYRLRIENWVRPTLADPSSAQFTFGMPFAGTIIADAEGERTSGAAVPVTLAVKDRRGDDQPPSSFMFFFFPSGRLIEVPASRVQPLAEAGSASDGR